MDADSRCSGRPASPPEIILHDQAENEPRRSHCPLQRAADLGFSDAWVVAYRDFNHAVSSQGAFEDHLHRPAIRSLLERERAQHIGAASAKRAKVADLDSIQKPDHASGETIPKRLMPGQSSSRTRSVQARTERNIRAPSRWTINDRRQQ